MSNKSDNSPSLDYFELRRRHEEYKNRERQAAKNGPSPQDSQEDAVPETPRGAPDLQADGEAQAVETPVSEPAHDMSQSEEAQTEAPVASSDAQAWSEDAGDAPEGEYYDEEAQGDYDGEAYDEEEYYDEDYDGEEYYDDEAPEEESEDPNPNPFDSFIRAFHGIRSHIGRKRHAEEDEAYEDEAYEDEEYEDGDYEDGDYTDDGADPDMNASEIPAEDVETSDAVPETGAVIEDLEDSAWQGGRRSRRHAAPQASDEEDDAYGDEDDYEDDEDEDDQQLTGFQRFIRKFVVPIDEDESDEADDDEDYTDDDEDDWQDDGQADLPEDEADEADEDDDASYRASAASHSGPRHRRKSEADQPEGGLDMADLNKVNAELTNELASSVETTGMSRRERRELAARLAAEKAAKEAAEQAANAAEDAEAIPREVEGVDAEKPLEADVIEDVAEGIVNVGSASEEDFSMVDEPTREYNPISKKAASKSKDDDEDDEEEEDEDEAPVRRGLFGFRKKSRDEDEDDDEDDEDDEEDEDDDEEDEKPRRGLFGRRKQYDDDDEDDEDDEDEDDDEEDVKPRRGLFGRRKKYDDDEDDDDEEDEDEDEKPSRRGRKGRRDRYDEDDEDDDDFDDFDDFDDDDDDDDYDDDEESGFGHALLGVLKGFLTAVVVLLVIVVILNLLDVFRVVNLDGIASRMPSRVVGILLPSQNFKHNGRNATVSSQTTSNVDSFNAAGSESVPLVTEAPAPDNDSFDEDAGMDTGDFGEADFEGEDFPEDTEPFPEEGTAQSSVG